jgi:small-conductance mechanosensitive channel/CRP-like cAMP-binding protein
MYFFTGGIAAIAILAFVVLAAFLVNRFAPKKRRHLRSTAVLSLLYLLTLGSYHLLAFLGLDALSSVVRQVAELFGVLTVVNGCALVLLDLGLPAVGVEIATILTDIAVGAAYIAAIMVTLHRAGFQLSGILATSALLTTITAFSLQGTLSNVVGGVALQLDSGIRVGDWVQLESGRQGKVREVRWRYTVIETRDWDTLIVPNATILSSTVTILGKREGQPNLHRMWVYFNVDFRFSPSDVIQAVDAALQAAPIEGVAAEPKPHCICHDFAKDHRDSFAYYAVRYWLTDLARDDPTSSRVRERIYSALKRAAIPLAVPATHVWVEHDDVERKERKQQREHDRRLKALRGVEFLRNLRDEELATLTDHLRYALFAPGEVITKQGAVAHWLYIIIDGIAEVSINVEGKGRKIAKIQAPGFVGEMGLMTGEPRSATVVALTEVECYRLDKDAFTRVVGERPEIAAEISAVLAHRKVELQAIREDMDAEAKQRCLEAENRRILSTIQRFFGLDDERTVVTSRPRM